MAYPLDDTICAIASPAGGGARGIVRISGPGAVAVAAALFEAEAGSGWETSHEPRAWAGQVRLPGVAAGLPATLYCWPTRRSYTRQPVVEVHTFGAPVLLERLVGALCGSGARLAEPGEFTLRAFLAGRLDLTQAEAVLGVIDSRGRREFEAALEQLAGGLAAPLRKLRHELVDLLADLEAGLDFVEEEIEFISREELLGRLNEAAGAVARLAEQMERRLETAEEPRVVLVGWPNVGKSGLFNALVGAERAIVSPTAGTTRDYLVARVELSGAACRLIDTAGAEPEATAGIAGAAQRLGGEQREGASVELFCVDSTRPLNAWERLELGRAVERRLVVLTKADAGWGLDREPTKAIRTSSVTGAGIDALRRAVAALIQARGGEPSSVASTALRCRESLRLAAACLERAAGLAAGAWGEELVAAEVRVALDELGKVAGAVYTEDLLDRIFSRFCIGK